MRRRLFCLPYFSEGTDPTVVVVTTPTEKSEPEPTPEDNKHLEIGTEIGQLKAQVAELQQKMADQASKIEMLESQDRWTDDRIRGLWEEMFRTQEVVDKKLEEMQEEQPEEVAEETVEAIPAIPAQVEPQGEPEPEAGGKRKGLLGWLL